MELDITTFRAMFTAYADETKYPDSLLNVWYPIGKCYIEDNDCVMAEDCRAFALMAMLAHLLCIQDQVNSGNQVRVITSASEGDVSVSLAEPPSGSNFSYWLNASPYGSQILGLLEVNFAGGDYIGGTERMMLGGGW
jgi:hypothetical protein